MTIATIDKSNAASVIDYLSQARTWLATCVEITGPEEIARAKAEIATAAEATKQLHLSREIQLDAQEMVRRAEYALGKSIRKGQAEGTIRDRSHGGPRSDYERGGQVVRVDRTADSSAISPKEFLPNGHDAHEVYAMTDGAPEPEQFDAAIDEAKAEGNLSRANVVRKVKKQTGPTTRDQRADLIADLAAQGYSSRQMPAKVGVTEESVRQIARDYDIEIPADKAIGRTRRVNSTQVVVNTATALEGLVAGTELVDFDALDLVEVRQWAASLNDSLKKLQRFATQIRKATQ